MAKKASELPAAVVDADVAVAVVVASEVLLVRALKARLPQSHSH